MTEICTPPIIQKGFDGDELVTFGPQHTWGDVVRWIAQNPADLEEVTVMIAELREPTTYKARIEGEMDAQGLLSGRITQEPPR